MFSTKTSAAGLSILSNSVLIASKLAVGLLMGSVSVLSEAIHSGVDLLAALIAFFSIRAAARPADAMHTFGHGKIENLSGTVEGVLIFGASILIVYEAVRKIVAGTGVDAIPLGISVMAVSAVVNWLVSRRLHAVAGRTDSVALEADAWHLTTDVYTSLGVTAGLLAVSLTGLAILDPLVAIGVAVLIIRAAWRITRKAFRGLLDVRLPKHELRSIRGSIEEHLGETVGFHDLRTRKAGSQRFVDLHLVFPKSVSLQEAHRLCDHLEEDIKRKLPGSLVTIHCEPCAPDASATCEESCPAGKSCNGTHG